MALYGLAEIDSAGPTEREPKVGVAEALVRETVERLSRLNPPHLVGVAARKDLMDLRPHLEEALEDIERRRDLSDRERDLQHAFKMLLAVIRRPP